MNYPLEEVRGLDLQKRQQSVYQKKWKPEAAFLLGNSTAESAPFHRICVFNRNVSGLFKRDVDVLKVLNSIQSNDLY